MGNNPRAFTKGSVLMVDPNPPDNNLVSSEELNIIVELETINKPRSAINVISQDDIQITSNNPNNLKVNFINGTEINGKKSLTTNYTEIGTEFNKINDDLETFGITSIDIDFNSSYAPIVKINFTDIRGRLFELGSDSPYNVFFSLPYPIFKLKVKGFYGKSVTYCLHLVNFNAEFDSKTGNFNIVGEFIGYTYALLSDMLLGYLKAIPETSFGQKIITREGSDFLKLNELTQRVEEFNKEIGNLKQSDDKIQELAKNEQIKVDLVELRSIINQGIDNIIDGRGIKNGTGTILIRKPSSQNETNIVNSKITVIREIISKEIVAFNNGTPDNLRLTDSDFVVERYFDVTKNNLSTVPEELKSNVENLLIRENPNNEQLFLVIDFSNGLTKITDYIRLIEKNVETIRKDVSIDIQTKIDEIFGFKPGIKNFIGILTDHVELLLDSIKDVSKLAESDTNKNNRIRLVREKGNFSDIKDGAQIFAFPEYTKKDDKTGVVQDAWLGNDYPSDVFPEIRLVEEILEGLLLSKKRDNELLESLVNNQESWYPINPFDTTLFNENGNPWETISEGSVNDLLRLMFIRATTYLTHSNTNLSDDEILVMAEIEANNAFNSISNKIVKETLSVYGGNTNPSTIINLVINEALNKDMSTIGTTNTTPNGFNNPVYKNEEFLNNGDAIFNNFTASNGFSGKFFDVGDPDPTGYLQYTYVTGNPVDGEASDTDKDFNRKYYLPLNKPFDGSDLSNKTDSEKISLRDNGKIFFGSYVGSNSENDNSRVDDGATYVKFIDPISYLNNNTLPEYGNSIINGKTINKNTVLDENSFNGTDNNIYANFSGKFGTQEFISYKPTEPISGREVLPTWLAFYDDFSGSLPNEKAIFSHREQVDGSLELKKTEFDIPLEGNPIIKNATNSKNLLNFASQRSSVHREILIDNINMTMPYNHFSTTSLNKSSLFGSYFYYQQETNQAKALLFLHTIPFNGLTETNGFLQEKGLFTDDIIKGLFNKRAGFINVPKSWILFMGALLWRESLSVEPIKFTTIENSIDYSLIFDIDFDDLELPTNKQYLTVKDGTQNVKSLGFKTTFTNDYIDLETIITKLPNQVKDEFITEFINWSNSESGWLKIKENAEIFKEGTSSSQIVNYWLNFNTENVISNLSNSIINENIIVNYGIIGKDNEISSLENVTTEAQALVELNDDNITYLPFNFFLEVRDNSLLNKNLNEFLITQKIIVNSTWRIWADNDLDGYIFDDRISEQSIPFRVLESKMGDYVKTFVQKFITLNENFRNNQEEEDNLKRELFNTINNDDIKISIYKNLKSIYDKWVCGSEDALFFCGTNRGGRSNQLIDSFRFIDRAFNDIGDDFKINPIDLTNLIKSNYNQSFYDYIGTLLRDNNFDFIPLPTYIDYNNEEDIKDVFRTFTYSEDVTTAGPQFICMYIGERSNRLDLTDSEYTNQGFDFALPDGSDGDIPLDFATSGTTPVVLVNYSSQNQSIFKNLKLNQKEFTETNESLWITDEISKRGAPTNRTGIGQNLYQLYLTRSYSCTVEAMGNAQIQPFMYFQLNNVPMFKGAYAIIHVNHKIIPHNMTTSFKGVRIKRPRTALVKDDSIYINLIGSLSDVNVGNFNLEDSNLSRARGGDTSNVSTRTETSVRESIDIIGIIIEE